MSHHESGPNSELRSEFKKLFGEFPDGRLNSQDEGAIPLAISVESGKVKLEFVRPVAWIAFTPEQAVELATSIIKKALQASDKPVILTLP